MKRFTIVFPLVVLAALLFAFVSARMRASAREVPSFVRPRELRFEAILPPHGDCTLSGRVVDIEGAPVAGVSLYFRSGGVPFWGVSDAAGEFAFDGLGEDEVQVAVLLWGHPPRMQRVTPGSVVELVIAPPNPPPEQLADVVASPLAGRVASPLGRAFWDPSGYEIAFVPRASPAELGGAVERRVHSSALGSFALPDLAHASYDVRVLPSWAAGSDWPDLVAPAYSTFDHGEGAPSNVAISQRCGALEAALVEASGDPLEGALVLLCDAAEPMHLWPPQATDPAGRFRFLDLPPGSYLLSIRAGEGAIEGREVHVENGQISRPDIEPIEVRRR